MQFTKLKIIRQNKKISRKKLCQDIGITVDFLKQLENTDVTNIDDTLVTTLVNIANYLNISIDDILPDGANFINSVAVPKGVTRNQVDKLYTYMVQHSGPITSKEDADKFFARFKYFIGDLKPEEDDIPESVKSFFNKNKVKTLLNELEINDNDIQYNSNSSYLDSEEDLIEKVKADTKIASTIYKELKDDGLNMIEAMNVLKVIIEVLWKD